MCAFWATLTSDFDALWDDRAWYPSGLARCIARAARPNPKAPALRPRGFFGYQKWWEYEAQVLIPYISNGPLIFWLYDVFSVRGASWFLGVSEWIFGALLFLGFWNKKLGILGAIGSCITFAGTVTIIPFMPNGWAAFCSKPLVVSIDSKGKPSKPECPECRSKSMLRPKQR